MSATLDCSLFSKYFSVIVRGKLEEAPVVSVGGWAYEVKEYYLDNLRTHGKVSSKFIFTFHVSLN